MRDLKDNKTIKISKKITVIKKDSLKKIKGGIVSPDMDLL